MHGQPIAAGLMVLATAYGWPVHRRAARRDGDHLLAARLQVTRVRSFAEIGIASRGDCRVDDARRSRPARARARATRRPMTTGETLYLTSGAVLQRLTLGYRRSPPTCTGFARFSISAAPGSGCSCPVRRRHWRPRCGTVPPAVSAARSHDDARSALQHRLPLRRHLPGRAVSRRCRAARSGDCAAREGSARLDPISGNTCTTSGSCTTGGTTTTRPRRSGSSGPARCRGRPGGCDRWRRRRSRRAATARRRADVGGRFASRATVDWSARDARARAGPAARARRARPAAAAVADRMPQADGAAAADVAVTLVRAGVLPGVPIDPGGTPYSDRRRRPVDAVARVSRCSRCRRSRSGRSPAPS